MLDALEEFSAFQDQHDALLVTADIGEHPELGIIVLGCKPRRLIQLHVVVPEQ
jgi:hypothetical protein